MPQNGISALTQVTQLKSAGYTEKGAGEQVNGEKMTSPVDRSRKAADEQKAGRKPIEVHPKPGVAGDSAGGSSGPAGGVHVNRVKTSDKQQKAVLDFIKG